MITFIFLHPSFFHLKDFRDSDRIQVVPNKCSFPLYMPIAGIVSNPSHRFLFHIYLSGLHTSASGSTYLTVPSAFLPTRSYIHPLFCCVFYVVGLAGKKNIFAIYITHISALCEISFHATSLPF